MGSDNGSFVTRLIEAARTGDTSAADQLLEGYRNYLRFLARDRVFATLQAKVDPSDVAQEVLMDARQSVAQFRGRTEPELLAWLRTILARHLVGFARKFHTPGGRKVVPEQSIEDILYQSSQALGRLMPHPGTSPSRHAVGRELNARVADALAQLPRDHEEVIRLRSFQELGWNEVARHMSRSNNAVRQLWVRAIKKLRPLVEGLR